MTQSLNDGALSLEGKNVCKTELISKIHRSTLRRLYKAPEGVIPLWPNMGVWSVEGPAKDYQMAQFREITLPLGVF